MPMGYPRTQFGDPLFATSLARGECGGPDKPKSGRRWKVAESKDVHVLTDG
jgi:hypothetical protein